MLYFDRNKDFDLSSKAIIDNELKELFQTEEKKNKMISYGPDLVIVHRGAKPLQVSVEKCA